jgi:hypothetical protein
MFNGYQHSSLFLKALATKKKSSVVIASSFYFHKCFNFELM